MIAKPTRVILVCILAIVVGACGSSDDSPEPGASAATTTTQPAPNMSEATDALSLQEAGSEPRQPLVLRVAAGTTRKVAFVSKFGLEMEVEGEALPEVRVPATRMVVEQRVDSVDADGTIRYSLAFTDVSVLSTPGVEQDVVTQTEAALAGIVGITGTGTMYVLEGGRAARSPALRTFDRSGRTLLVAELAERTATQVLSLIHI